MTTSSLPDRKTFFRIPDASVFAEPSVWVLVAVNLLPLVGVFFFDWDLFSLMVLYWMETAMIGFYQLLKILIHKIWLAILLVPFFTFHFGMFMYVHFMFISSLFGPPWVKAMRASVPDILDRLLFQEGFWIPALALFVSHGVSFFMHGLKQPTDVAAKQVPTAPSPAIHPHPDAAAYHSTEDWKATIDPTPLQALDPTAEGALPPVQSKIESFLLKPATTDQEDLMLVAPYKRIVIMHVTIILGGMLAMVLKTTKVALVVMILMKIAADLFSHANYHGLGGSGRSSEEA